VFEVPGLSKYSNKAGPWNWNAAWTFCLMEVEERACISPVQPISVFDERWNALPRDNSYFLILTLGINRQVTVDRLWATHRPQTTLWAVLTWETPRPIGVLSARELLKHQACVVGAHREQTTPNAVPWTAVLPAKNRLEAAIGGHDVARRCDALARSAIDSHEIQIRTYIQHMQRGGQGRPLLFRRAGVLDRSSSA